MLLSWPMAGILLCQFRFTVKEPKCLTLTPLHLHPCWFIASNLFHGLLSFEIPFRLISRITCRWDSQKRDACFLPRFILHFLSLLREGVAFVEILPLCGTFQSNSRKTLLSRKKQACELYLLQCDPSRFPREKESFTSGHIVV